VEDKMSTSPEDRELSLTAAWRIDAVCRRFEAAWKSAKPPRLENFLEDAQGSKRRVLLR
jgi:hypothetical protein